MRTLRKYNDGVDVYFLQRLLNKAAKVSRGKLRTITEDGKFGHHTETAVWHFQKHADGRSGGVDGVVGTRTWHALGLKAYVDHSRRVTLIPQTSNWSCWEAASSMVSQAYGRPMSVATSPDHMQYYLSSGMDGREADLQLRKELGWNELNHSPNLQELIQILRRGPIYVAGDLTATGGAHAVAFVGIFSDGMPDGTVIKVFNPSPVGSGLIHQLFFDSMVSPLSGSPFVPRSYLIPP